MWGASQAYGFTKEKLMALREFVPYFSENSTLLPVYEDGRYKYIDFSRAFFYDVGTQPFQTTLTETNRREDDPVIPSIVMGLTKAFAKLISSLFLFDCSFLVFFLCYCFVFFCFGLVICFFG